jgi:hypothetical protein
MRHGASNEVIYMKNSPAVTEETISGVVIVSSSVVSEESLAAMVDRLGLVLIDMFRANEMSADEDILRDELARGVNSVFDPVSSRSSIPREDLAGEACSPAATL